MKNLNLSNQEISNLIFSANNETVKTIDNSIEEQIIALSAEGRANSIADLRDALPQYNRLEIDEVLLTSDRLHLIAKEANITKRDAEAAISIVGWMRHEYYLI